MFEAGPLVLVVLFFSLAAISVFVARRYLAEKPELPNEPKPQTPAIAESAAATVSDAADAPDVAAGPDVAAIPDVAAVASAEPAAETLNHALEKTRSHFWGRVKSLFQGQKLDLSDLEEILYTSDLGPKTVERLLSQIEPATAMGLEAVKTELRKEFETIFAEAHSVEPGVETLTHLKLDAQPVVWMVVGVNGAGKTTSIGKIAAQLASQGKKVIVAAGDTFRAAAGAQLRVWTERAEKLAAAGELNEGLGAVEIFHPEGVSDPSAVAFDAVAKAKARHFDVVIIDTAGRLHTQAHLMDELKKVKRVLAKVIPEAPHETLIVLDANNGQNALHQAREFNQAVGLTGVILTKMDGTAKGGVAVGLSHELKLPIRLIGVGEKVQDLRAFSSREFIASILDEA